MSIDQEYKFSVYGDSEDIPNGGVVILLNPSTNGHVQMLCRERGALCFFAPPGHPGRKTLHDLGEASPQTLQFVSDGRIGRIYSVNEGIK